MAELATSTGEMREEKPFEVVEVSADPAVAHARGLVDFNFFAGLMIPTVMEFDFPPFYLGIFALLKDRKPHQLGRILRFALGLPRGHAKTTFIKILIAWLIVYDKISFAVIICANDELAEELISDVNDMLCSENCTLVYGDWGKQLTTDNRSLKKAQYHGRDIILAAKGAGSATRGLNIKHRRPDLIFCDDAQTKECDESPTERVKFRRWLVATFKIISPRGDRLIIYVGNMYSEECVLFQLKENKSWVSLITGAIKEDGQPLWPELHPIEELMESYFHDEELGEADVWFAEVMNDPVNRATSLLGDSLPDVPKLTEEMLPDGVFITVDPAGFKDNSDDNVIVVHYVIEGKGCVAEVDAGIKDPEQLIIRTLQLAFEHGASLIGIEEVGYQQTLLFWIRKYLMAEDVHGIEVVPLKPAGRAKESRIRLFIAELYALNYYLFTGVKSAFVWQAMKYKLGKKKNKDDLLDACAYGLDVRTEYWHLVKNLRTEHLYRQTAQVVHNNTPF
jgi:hypothetical protein